MGDGRATISAGFHRFFPIKIAELNEATRSLMSQIRKVCGLAAVLSVCAASLAGAQTPQPSTSKFFVHFNAGGQVSTRSLGTAVSQTVYDETATLLGSTPIGKGFVPDFGGGYRVWGDVYVGVSFAVFSHTSAADTVASIPDPLVFNNNKVTFGTVDGLKHTEFSVLPELIYVGALTDKIDVVGRVGPAIIHVSQDVVNAFSVPPGSQDAVITPGSESATGTGFNVALGANYNLNERYAVGLLIRYAGAKVSLPSGLEDLSVGGGQLMGGIRVNF
jgi:opacity protein-like surface antigen